MKQKLILIAIGVLEAFIALSTIAGGILMLAGTYQNGILVEVGEEVSFRWHGYKIRLSAITPFPRSSWRLSSEEVRS